MSQNHQGGNNEGDRKNARHSKPGESSKSGPKAEAVHKRYTQEVFEDCQSQFGSLYGRKGANEQGAQRFHNSPSTHCQNYTSSSGTAQTKSQIIPNDSLNTEFIFYIGAIKELLPALSNYGDQIKVLPWLKKLASPEYQASRLRTKRNKYLLHLMLVMINDTIFGIFKDPPAFGKLHDISTLKTPENLPLARWEKDTYWSELLEDLKDEDSTMTCYCHTSCVENEQCGNVYPAAGALLDEEFMFFLYMAKPLVALITDIRDKGLCATWILTLAKVRTCSCLTMKAIRNDYMQALLGYLQDLRMVRPFNQAPPENGGTLKPLAELAENKTGLGFLTQSITNPCSDEAQDFMQQQPVPDSGAFCYIAITGNVTTTNETIPDPESFIIIIIQE